MRKIHQILIIATLLLFSIISLAQNNEIDSLENLLETLPKDDESRAKILNELAYNYYTTSSKKCIEYSQKALDIAIQTQNKKQMGNAYFNIGVAYYSEGNYQKALKNWKKKLEVNKQQNDSIEIASSYSDIGILYKNWGDYDTAVIFYQKALKIYEEGNFKKGQAYTLINIGNIYFYFGKKYQKALDYYSEALALFKELGNEQLTARTLNNIGMVYYEQKQSGKALEYFKKSLDIYIKLNFESGIATTRLMVGSTYKDLDEYQKAFQNMIKALDYYKKIDSKREIANATGAIAEVFFKQKKYNQALNYYKESLEQYNASKLIKEALDTYKAISKVYSELGNYQKSLENYKRYSELRDSIFTEESHNQITEMQTKYETEKKEQQIKILNQEKNLKETQIRQQRLVIYFFIGGLAIVLVFSFLLYKQFNEKRKANIQLAEQNVEIKQQRDKIFQQKQEITDSIHYARRIQAALLPPPEQIDNILPEYFILNKPRDIVSGDFYWMAQKGKQTVVVAADCTGHGVPGAFMSMLGVTFLNEIVNTTSELKANEMLNQLRLMVINSLHQTGKEGEAKDGMDIALYIIDFDSYKLQFAGAYNPLLLIREGKMIQHKADKMPIGIYIKKEKPFTNHEIEVKKGDILYTYSDGYVDQFGGDEGRKFLSKRFKKLLLEIHDKSMDEQKQILDHTIEQWHGEKFEQLDDILVIGTKI